MTNQIASVSNLRPNPWNTNIMTPENEAKVMNSIKKLGIFKPILVREVGDGQLEILGGQHRWEALVKMGAKETPIFNVGKISDKKAKEIGLADNARYGYDDTLALSSLLSELGTAEEINEFLPYSQDELSAIFSASDISLDQLDIPDDGTDHSALPIKAAPTQQVMRFKVPIEDSAWIQQLIEDTIKKEAFTKDDALSNAGNALVHILNEYRNK